MVGCGSATAANESYSRGYEFARIARHVLRRAQINIPSIHRARDTGIRLRCQRQGSQGTDAFHGVQHGDGSNTAIAANDVRTPLAQFGTEGLRIGSVQAVAIFVDSDLRYERNRWMHVPCREQGLMNFFQISESLEDQQIDSAFY